MMKKRTCITALLSFTVLGVLFAVYPDSAFAWPLPAATADNSTITNGKDVFGSYSGTWGPQLQQLAGAIFTMAKYISIAMVCAGGLMVALGIEDGKKVVWNYILGAGLALNIASFLFNGIAGTNGFESVPTDAQQQEKFEIKIAGTKGNGTENADTSNFNILGDFMNYYENKIIVPGAARIVPIAFNLTLILAAIDASLKLSMDLISGDKIKFLVSVCLKIGFLLFLIHNWFGGTGLNLMGSLGEGFQSIGFAAGGAPEGKLNPNSIVDNGIAMVMAIWGPVTDSFSIRSPLNSLVQILLLIPVAIFIFLTGIEIFMARIEFYTMALVTIPLIPFGALKQTNFLFEKAIGAMFNLAVKLCVICFLQSAIMKIFGDYAESIAAASKADKSAVGVSMILQLFFVTLIMYFLVKKIPELVQGLLSGNPALNGGGMMQQLRSAASGGAQAAGALVSGGAAVGGKAIAGAVSGAKAGFKAAGGGKAGAVMGAVGALGGGIGGAAMGAGGLMKGAATSAAAKAMQPFNKGVNAVANAQDGIMAGKSKFNIPETRTGGGSGGDGAGGGSGAQEARGGSQEGNTSHGSGADSERGKSAAQEIGRMFGPGGEALKDAGGAAKGAMSNIADAVKKSKTGQNVAGKVDDIKKDAMKFIPSPKAMMAQQASKHPKAAKAASKVSNTVKTFGSEYSSNMKAYSNPPAGSGGANVSKESKTSTQESTSPAPKKE